MSADNYIGVLKTKNGRYGIIPYGNMSMLDEDCQYRGRVEGSYLTERAEALVKAHDMLKEQPIVEYGVIEFDEPDEPCGRCFVCVNERNLIADDIPKCDGCRQPITTSDWSVSSIKGTFHNRCEPR